MWMPRIGMPLDLVAVDGADVGDEVHVSLRVGGLDGAARCCAIDDAGTALDIRSDVDWHERQKLLKLAFAFDVHAEESELRSSSGTSARPYLGEHLVGHGAVRDLGAPLGASPTRGPGGGRQRLPHPERDVSRRTRADGGTTAASTWSLLRAPLFPTDRRPG